MEGLVQPTAPRAHLIWTEEETGLRAAAEGGSGVGGDLYRGDLPRGEASEFLGLTTRHARRIVAQLA